MQQRRKLSLFDRGMVYLSIFLVKLAIKNPCKGDTPRFVDNKGEPCIPALCYEWQWWFSFKYIALI